MADIFITSFRQSFFKLSLSLLEKTKLLTAGPKPTDIKGFTMCFSEVGSGEKHKEVGMSIGTAARAQRTESPMGRGRWSSCTGLHGACALGTYLTPGSAKVKQCRSLRPLGGWGHHVYWNSEEKQTWEHFLVTST